MVIIGAVRYFDEISRVSTDLVECQDGSVVSIFRWNDGHRDQRQDRKEQAEDPPAEGVAAFHRSDDCAHGGGDDATDRDEYSLDAAQYKSGGFGLALYRQHYLLQHTDSSVYEPASE
jgi:hypothetical protein